VNTFLKIKREANGGPDWVGDDVNKRTQYLADCRDKEGIQLEADKIQKTRSTFSRQNDIKQLLG